MGWRGIGGAVGVVWLVACGGASEGGDATGANGAGAESAAGGAGDPGPGGAGAGGTGAGNASAGGAGGGAGEGGSGNPPPGRILFQMDYAESAWPLAGWPWTVDEAFGVRWTRELLPGAGPNGQNVAQLTELPGTGQHGWGWHGHVVPQMEQGEARFFRWRHRVTEESNCAVTTSNKLLVVAQGCEGGLCRVIVQPKCNPEGLIQYNFQVDGGVYQVETGYVYPKGQWLNVQLEIQTSSARGRADGALREWIDSDDYDAPTIANTDIELIAGGESSAYVIFGGYNNTEEVPAGATNVQQYTDFEIGTAFDPAWSQR